MNVRCRQGKDGVIDPGVIHKLQMLLCAPFRKRKAVIRDDINTKRVQPLTERRRNGVRMKIDGMHQAFTPSSFFRQVKVRS